VAEALILYSNRLFTGNRSQVHRWGRRLGNDFEGFATAWAPMRSGELKASIYSEVSGVGKQMDIIIGARADHAIFVIMGTGQYVGRPRLRAIGGDVLAVGKQRMAWRRINIWNEGVPYFFKGAPYIGRGVSGQAPQNFFETAHHFLIPLHPSTAHIDWHDVPKHF
jgi:hypothetical protein